ncbi:glucokinase [Candidatus Woesearchaeota archaeon]|nr:glucokinase [Candidatus Woesearchaeota archaeon]
MNKTSQNSVFVADIGATYTRIGIGKKGRLVHVTTFRSGDQERFLQACKDAFAEHRPNNAIIAAAGPCADGRIHLTNLGWVVDAKQIRRRLGLGVVKVANDIETMACAIPFLLSRDVKNVYAPTSRLEGPISVVAAGTGLGRASLIGSRIIPSEAGHTHAPCVTSDEYSLCRFIQHKRKLCLLSYEDILSGRGVSDVYHFVSGHRASAEEIGTMKKTLETQKTWEIIQTYYARFCQDTALETLCYGGLYIAGGLASHNPHLFDKRFVRLFRTHDTMQHVLARIPVRFITHPYPGLIGAMHMWNVRRNVIKHFE